MLTVAFFLLPNRLNLLTVAFFFLLPDRLSLLTAALFFLHLAGRLPLLPNRLKEASSPLFLPP